MRGVPRWVVGRQAGAATGAFGGDPHGDTKRVRDVPKLKTMMVMVAGSQADEDDGDDGVDHGDDGGDGGGDGERGDGDGDHDGDNDGDDERRM